MRRIYLLSPASCHGKRAHLLRNPRAEFPLARALRSSSGVAIGEVFSFVSGLYFRGKLAYARAFAMPPAGVPGVLVITPDEGLCAPERTLDMATFTRWADVRIDVAESRWVESVGRAAAALAGVLARRRCEVVLLGSIATPKYLAPFGAALGDRLRYPETFVGRGDMSRGALMLRSVRDGRRLDYVAAAGTGFAPSSHMMDARPRHAIRTAPQGAPVLEREWTSRSVDDECATLEAALVEARQRADGDDVRRIEARLRLLRADD